MKACGTAECNQGRGEPCKTGCIDASGARMCGAWPYVGTPTSPGKLTEAELDAHNQEMRGVDIDRVHFRPRVEPALDGPYRLTWRERLRRWLSHAWHG